MKFMTDAERCPMEYPHGDRCALPIADHGEFCNHRVCGCNEPNRYAMSEWEVAEKIAKWLEGYGDEPVTARLAAQGIRDGKWRWPDEPRPVAAVAVTVDDLTDATIRGLMDSVSWNEVYDGHPVKAMCQEALGLAHIHGSTMVASKRRVVAYLNARSSKAVR